MEEIKSEVLRITRFGEKGIESGSGVHILAIKRTTTWLYKKNNGLRLPAGAYMSLGGLFNIGTI